MVAEGAVTGIRNISLATGGPGTLTISATGVVRLANGAGGGLFLSNLGGTTLINDGLISAEATNQTLTIQPNAFTNNSVVSVARGTLRVNAATWTNAGTLAGTGGVLQLGGTLNAGAGIGTFNTAGTAVQITGTIANSGNTIQLTAMTGSFTMSGGTISGGALNWSGGAMLRISATAGTLANVALNGDLLLDIPGATVILSGNTTFTAARLAVPANLQLAPGYVLNSLVVAEGAAIGDRFISSVSVGTGTVTFGPAAVIRLASGTVGGLNLINGSVNSSINFVNNGLITAEATGRILHINPRLFTNNGTLSVSAGTLHVNAYNGWTNPGTISGTGGTFQLGGILFATSGIGTLNTAGANVLVSGSIVNTDSTIHLNSNTGSFTMSGGYISGGTILCSDAARLRTSISGGELLSVAYNGELLFDVDFAGLTLRGSTSFIAARLSATYVSLRMARDYTLNSLVVAEGAATGVRTILLAYGDVAGTVTFGPSAIVRHLPGSGGELNIRSSSQATLINQGLISAEASGQTLLIDTTAFSNVGTLAVAAGTLHVNSASWTTTGALSGTGGELRLNGNLNATAGVGTFNTLAATVHVVGNINNANNTIQLNATSAPFTMLGGTISGGSINYPGGAAIRATTSNGTLAGVNVNGDLLLDTNAAALMLSGNTTFAAARLTAPNVNLGLAPGYTLNSLIVAEGAASGPRVIALAFGGEGTVTFGSAAVVRLAADSGGALNIVESGASTLINSGLITAEARFRTVSIAITTITNHGTLRVQNSARIGTTRATWTNAGILDLQTGEIFINGADTFTNSGTINLGPGCLLNVATSSGLNFTSPSVVNTFIAGIFTSQFGRILVTVGDANLGGTLNITLVDNYQPSIASTFNILTVVPSNRTITSGFDSTTLPPPGVDGKNFMYNDDRHIIFAFSSLADYNSDTIVDLFDYLDFVNDFANQTGGADFNNDGVIDFFDYLDFLVIFSRF